MGLLDDILGPRKSPNAPGELLQMLLAQGYRGWVRIRFRSQPNFWSPGIVTQYAKDDFYLAVKGGLDDIRGRFDNIEALEVIVDPVKHPLPSTTDNRLW